MPSTIAELLSSFIPFTLYCFATAGLASFARALPWPSKWTKMKPLACPVCMAGWAGIAVLGADYERLQAFVGGPGVSFFAQGAQVAFIWFSCIAVGALVFKQLYPPDIELPMP